MTEERTEAHIVRCQDCGVPLQGASVLCVACYHKAHRPCPKCMVYADKYGRRMVPRNVDGKPVDCEFCHNERYVLMREKKQHETDLEGDN